MYTASEMLIEGEGKPLRKKNDQNDRQPPSRAFPAIHIDSPALGLDATDALDLAILNYAGFAVEMYCNP